MSDQRTEEFPTAALEVPEAERPGVDPQPARGSLEARMAERAEYLERHQSEWFGVPGYEDVLEVELRAVSFAAQDKIAQRHQKIMDPGTQKLYVMADTIIAATVGFREVLGEARESLGEQETWASVARRLPGAPTELTERQAVLFVVGDKRPHYLYARWNEWAAVVRPDIDKEVVQDFGKTRSRS